MGKSYSAIAEERLNRVKHYAGFPALAVKACLDAVGAKITDIDHVAVGQDSDANLAQKVQYALANPAKILKLHPAAPAQGTHGGRAVAPGRGAGCRCYRAGFSGASRRAPHRTHCQRLLLLAVEQAAGFSYDGSGDFVSTMMARCAGNDITVLERVFLPHSLGSFYTRPTASSSATKNTAMKAK